ncbi:MAG TPA: PilZ domain-containing protein [Myxococcota bacterium]
MFSPANSTANDSSTSGPFKVAPSTRASDKRRSKRFARSIDVDIVDKRGARRGRAVDVSRHGLFVAVVDPPANRHLVQLIIQLPDGPMPAAATVSRTLAGQGVGLSLFALSSDAKRRWDAFIIRTQQELTDPRGLPLPELAKQIDDAAERARAALPMTTMLPAPVAKAPDVPSFVVKLKTVERLKDYLQAHVAVGGTVLFTPVLPPAGSAVSLLVVHPISEAEFPLAGHVHRAITQAPKRLEILFDRIDVVAFARFVETGQPPLPVPPPMPSTAALQMLASLPPMTTPPTTDPSLSTSASPVALKTPSQVQRELEFEIDDAAMPNEDPISWDLNASELPVLVGHIDEPSGAVPEVQLEVLAGGADDVVDAAHDDADADGAHEELVIDDTRPAPDPGLRPTTLHVHCNGMSCESDGYVLELGPCHGVLGLVADLVPFFSPENNRVVSVPRLVPAELRRERFHHYAQRGGQIDDVVALSMFLTAADLAEAPRHPVTAELLRTSRGIEQLQAGFLEGKRAHTTKIRCPCCEDGHLVIS